MSSKFDALCPRLPICAYATEARAQVRRIHAFRTIRQRDQWIDGDRDGRICILPTDDGVYLAWANLTMILHPHDGREPLKLS